MLRLSLQLYVFFVLYGIHVLSQPAPPSGFGYESIYSTSFILSWNEVDDTTYKMVIMNGGGTINSCDAGNNVNSPHTVDQLTSLTSYRIGLCAVNSIGQSSNPSTLSITTGPPPPYNIKVSSSTTTTLTVEWNDECADGIAMCDNDRTTDQYVIRYDDGEGSLTRTVDAPTTQYTITNQRASSTYDITVKIVGRESNIYSDESQVVTGITFPGQPNPPTSTSSTTTSITLQWNDIAGTVQETYTVIQNGVEVMSGINTNMATIDGLTSNTNYQFQIKASNDGGDGQISDAQTSTTIPGQPNPPTSTTLTTTSITLHWIDLAGRVQETYTVIQDGVEVISGINTNMAIIDGLTSNTNYQFQIKASNGGGDGQISDAQTLTTIPSKPNPPTSISSTTTSITLQWNDIAGTAHETYTVIQDGVEVMSGINTNMATIDGLTSNTNYQFQIQASNDGGDGQISDPQSTLTNFSPPNTPRIDEATDSSIKIEWDSPDVGGGAQQITGYNVVVTPDDQSLNVTDTTASITGLTSNTEYSVIVSAISEDGNLGTQSNALLVTTVPSKSNQPTLVSATSSSITLKWIEVDEGDAILTYTVVWSLISDTESQTKSGIKDTSTTLDGLYPNTKYIFQIFSSNSVGDGEISESAVFETVAASPNQPEVIYASTTSITLQWNKTSGSNKETYTVIQDGEEVMTGLTTTLVTIEMLIPNTNYRFEVRVTTDAGDGEVSNAVTATTLPLKSDEPIFDDVTTTSITLQWNDLAGTAQETYTLIQDGVDVMSGINTNMATIDDLTSNTNYQFQIKANNNGGDGQISDGEFCSTVPDAVNSMNLIDGPDPSTSIELSWNKPEGGEAIDDYTLQWKALTTNTIDTDIVLHFNGQLSYKYIKTGLIPEETYEIIVTSRNEAGSSSSSPEKHTTKSDDVCFQAIRLSGKSIRLEWNQPKKFNEAVIVARNTETTKRIKSNESIAELLGFLTSPVNNISIYPDQYEKSEDEYVNIENQPEKDNSLIIGLGVALGLESILVIILLIFTYYYRRTSYLHLKTIKDNL